MIHSYVLQPIADRLAEHLEIISKSFQIITRRTKILMGFIIYYLVLIIHSMGRILVLWNFLEIISRDAVSPYLQLAVAHIELMHDA